MNKRCSTLSVPDKISAGANLTVEEFAAWASVGRAKAFAEIASGRLVRLKIGKSTRIAASDAIAWRDAQRSATPALAEAS
ncbi:MAG TPA: hypothetical protein VKA03_04435 [Methylovirgula sp.]|nr:hypothetical protein [Methylovirgula sp.]